VGARIITYSVLISSMVERPDYKFKTSVLVCLGAFCLTVNIQLSSVIYFGFSGFGLINSFLKSLCVVRLRCSALNTLRQTPFVLCIVLVSIEIKNVKRVIFSVDYAHA